MIALPIILSSNGLASEIIFGQNLFITAIDTTGQPGDSIRIVYDSAGIPIDTIRNDSAQSNLYLMTLLNTRGRFCQIFNTREKSISIRKWFREIPYDRVKSRLHRTRHG